MSSDRPSTLSFAAVDLGASSGRVVLATIGIASVDGSPSMTVTEVHRFSNGPVVSADGVHWDTDSLLAETLVGLAAAVSAAGGTLAGIGIDSWGVDYALVDDPGASRAESAGSRAPLVRHYRGADPGGPAAATELVPEAAAYEITGVLSQAINTSFRLRADLASADGVAPAGHLLLVPDLWAFILTGRRGAELTIASTTQLVDARTNGWSSELIEAWGLDRVDFPELSPPGTLAGPTTQDITERIGAVAPVPVYRVASHDTASALAFARPDSGELLISSGSWSLTGLCLSAPNLTDAARLAGFTNESGVDGSTLLLRNLSGMMLVTECIRSWAGRGETSASAVGLVREAIDAGDSVGDVPTFDVADPRLLGTADMPRRIAELCRESGQLAPVGVVATVVSIIESLAVAYAAAAVTCAELSGTPVTSIRIVGGGSRNELLCRRTAELSGLPITVGPAEATALGNLAVQMCAAGVFGSLDDAYRALSDPGDAVISTATSEKSALL